MAEYQQTFRTQPAETRTAIGGAPEVILHCAIDNIAGRVQWTKDGSALAGSHRNLPGYPRYTITGTESIGEFHLRIAPVLLEDDGIYECQVGPSSGHTALRSTPARLIIQIPPEPPVIVGSKLRSVNASVSTNLTCHSAYGNPAPTITWKKNGIVVAGAHSHSFLAQDETGKLSNTSSALVITPSIADMGAVYTCESINLALELPLSSSTTLDVQYAPMVGVIVDPEVTREGETISLKCKVDANPMEGISYEWLKDRVVMSDLVGDTIALEAVPPEYNQISIMCRVTNTAGKGNASRTLTVQYGPRITKPPEDTAVDIGSTATFQCEAVGNPTPKITWKRLGSNVMLSGMSTLQIDKVHDTDFGVYVCTAHVPGFEDATTTATLHINSAPIITSNPIQYAELHKTASLLCFTNTRPLPDKMEWEWEGGSIESGRDGRYSASIVDVEVYGGKLSNLTIRKVNRGDFMVYNCTVTNSMGIETFQVTLKEKEPPPLIYIIGGVFGGFALILLVAVIVVLINRCPVRRKQRKAEKERIEISPSQQKETFYPEDKTPIEKKDDHEPFYTDDLPYGTLNKKPTPSENMYGSQRSHPRSRTSFVSQHSSHSIDVLAEPQNVDYRGPASYGAPYDRRPLDMEPRDYAPRDYVDRDYPEPEDYPPDRDYPPPEPRRYDDPEPQRDDPDYRPPSRASSRHDEFYGPQPPLGSLATNV
ncbi:kin of IRRE-like protein 3 [Glandiceps talaboti]